MNKEVCRIETERDLTRIKIHVDMDAFFAAVETRDDPSLREIPMGVGSDLMLVSLLILQFLFVYFRELLIMLLENLVCGLPCQDLLRESYVPS